MNYQEIYKSMDPEFRVVTKEEYEKFKAEMVKLGAEVYDLLGEEKVIGEYGHIAHFNRGAARGKPTGLYLIAQV